MDANGHEKNASQTSPMMLMILRRHDFMIAKYQDGFRLLGGFHPLRETFVLSFEGIGEDGGGSGL